MGAGRFEAESAGTAPAAEVNPSALEALGEAGVEWRGHPPRNLDGLEARDWDLVVTVCDDARESCPIFPAGPIVAHWGMADPAAVTGEAARREAFRHTVELLRRRIGVLVALPVEQSARAELAARIAEIGRPR
jgi:arsenate reductase